MLPLELRPFWPLLRSRIVTALQTRAPQELAQELAQSARGDLPQQADRLRLANVLEAAAAELRR